MDNKFKGLNSSQIEENRSKYGNNKIIEAEPPTFWSQFMEGFEDPMIKILCGISALMIALYIMSLTGIVPHGSVEIYEPLGTIIAILIVNFIGARTSMASDAAYRKLKDSIKKDTVKCYRNGVLTVVEIDDVVVGDIVLLQSGDKIPADGVLVSGDLRVDNSALNGEPEECKKFAAEDGFKIPEEITGDTFVDKHSLFRGAIIFNGEGLMEVQKVGMSTMMGKMAEDMQSDEVDSPLKVKLGKLAEQISTFGYAGAVLISIAYLVHFVVRSGGVSAWLSDFRTPTNVELALIIAIGVITTAVMSFLKLKNRDEDVNVANVLIINIIIGFVIALIASTVMCDLEVFSDIREALMVAVVIIVCAVPEGLPLMISLVLMQNTGKLLEHNCLVRKAIGIETAGSLSILFSDKTGTITKGKLEVVSLFDGAGKDINKTAKNKVSELINLAIGRNTSSKYDLEHNVIGGNATDQALLKFVGEDAYNDMTVNNVYDINESQNFNSANKFSQARINGIGKTLYKGAPERLLAKATKYIDTEGNVKPINVDVVNNKIDELANKAMRVLAFGYSESNLVENEINDDLVIVGFAGIRDDVRPEARDAIKEVQEAGIQVVMITGDKLETAVAIAKDAGLLGGKIDIFKGDMDLTNIVDKVRDMDTIALTSEVLNKLSDDDVKGIVGKIRVIARALPTDKSRMVRICQELNLVTGMTGDGRRYLCPILQ